jgi:hypothetical protein
MSAARAENHLCEFCAPSDSRQGGAPNKGAYAMASKASIVAAIETKKANTKYSIWRIGLTNDPKQRKEDWENPTYWSQWAADSLSDAQDIEAHFIDKGMQGGTGGDLSSRSTTYVYVF